MLHETNFQVIGIVIRCDFNNFPLQNSIKDFSTQLYSHVTDLIQIFRIRKLKISIFCGLLNDFCFSLKKRSSFPFIFETTSLCIVYLIIVPWLVFFAYPFFQMKFLYMLEYITYTSNFILSRSSLDCLRY